MAALIDITVLGHTYKVVDPSTHAYGQYEHSDEMPIKQRFWSDIQPGEVVVCIGASWGGYVLPALAQGARVIAVEPADVSCAALRRSVEANGWSDRLTLWQGLLWDGTSAVPEAFRAAAVRNFGGTDEAPIQTLDQLVCDVMRDPDARRVDRIHCDAEGAELPIMRGAPYTLGRFKPRLLIEDHTKAADDPDAHLVPYCVGIRDRLIPKLEYLGYRVECVHQVGGGNPFLWAEAA